MANHRILVTHPGGATEELPDLFDDALPEAPSADDVLAARQRVRDHVDTVAATRSYRTVLAVRSPEGDG